MFIVIISAKMFSAWNSCYNPIYCSQSYNQNQAFFSHSWLITWFVARVTRRVPLSAQKLFTLPYHLSSLPDFRMVRVGQSLVLCVVLSISLFVFLSFSVGHCVVCPSIYGFWSSLCYLQTFFGKYFDIYIFVISYDSCNQMNEWPVMTWSYCSWIYYYVYAICAYYHWCCEFESRSGRGVQHYVIHFVRTTDKTDRHDITEILLKVTIITIKQTLNKWIPMVLPVT